MTTEDTEVVIARIPARLMGHFIEFLDSLEGASQLSAYPLSECEWLEVDEGRIVGKLETLDDDGEVVSMHVTAFESNDSSHSVYEGADEQLGKLWGAFDMEGKAAMAKIDGKTRIVFAEPFGG